MLHERAVKSAFYHYSSSCGRVCARKTQILKREVCEFIDRHEKTYLPLLLSGMEFIDGMVSPAGGQEQEIYFEEMYLGSREKILQLFPRFISSWVDMLIDTDFKKRLEVSLRCVRD